MGAIFGRLIGLETEYGIRFRPDKESSTVPTKFALYQSLIHGVQKRVLTVDAKHFKEGVFTANGGAVWFEATAGGGLIEGATPECRGPRELLLYQRAQDRLLSDCANTSSAAGQFRLIKNDRDSRGNIYGAQENYEVEIAGGVRLGIWRVGLIAMIPLVLATWLGFLVLLLGLGIYFVLAGTFCFLAGPLFRNRSDLSSTLFGHDASDASPTPGWLEGTLMWLTRVLTAPLAGALYVLLWLTAFRRLRRELLPLLVSRSIIGGVGMLDEEGRFHLSDKASAMNCLMGFGGFVNDRPIFVCGHFLKTLCLQAWFSPREYLDLFQQRQRLQIGLGDSNMAEVSEFLRVGTTLLTIDAIEAGFLRDIPFVKRPLRSIRKICADPSLTATVPLHGGKEWTALEIQRFYLERCRDFVAAQSAVPNEAHELLRVWEETLSGLEQDRHGLVGSVDWITKQHLLSHAGADATWQQRKKIDLRYHELSPEGYFQILRSSGIVRSIVDDELLARAVRSAPADSPATTRGHYIREFGDGAEQLAVNWKCVTVGSGASAKVIRLARYGRRSDDSNRNDRNSRLASPAD